MAGYSAVAPEASYIDDDKLFGATAEYPTTLVHLIYMCREALKIEA